MSDVAPVSPSGPPVSEMAARENLLPSDSSRTGFSSHASIFNLVFSVAVMGE